jgi:hypothetical protein
LAWHINQEWSTKLSFGETDRYPPASTLYRIRSTGKCVFHRPGRRSNAPPSHRASVKVAL